jgi:hypothetical protein
VYTKHLHISSSWQELKSSILLTEVLSVLQLGNATFFCNFKLKMLIQLTSNQIRHDAFKIVPADSLIVMLGVAFLPTFKINLKKNLYCYFMKILKNE